jgi:LuxR family maltose regulon positive regulatory protein
LGVASDQSDLEEAFAVNQRAMQLAASVSPWYFHLSACNEVWLNLQKGDVPLAAHKLKEVESRIEEPSKVGGVFLETKVSLLSAQGNHRDILETLEEGICGLEQSEKYWTLLNLLPFQALALQALGREEEALRVICRCLAFTAPEGYIRIFVNRGAPMARLLQVAINRGIETEYIQKLLDVLRFAALPGASKVLGTQCQPLHLCPGLIESLSDREVQVLRLLDSRLTNEEIGQELYVSVNTIRTHIRNIYSKLGVNRRGQAVDKAKELKLI